MWQDLWRLLQENLAQRALERRTRRDPWHVLLDRILPRSRPLTTPARPGSSWSGGGGAHDGRRPHGAYLGG
jgi:hypothetical protein